MKPPKPPPHPPLPLRSGRAPELGVHLKYDLALGLQSGASLGNPLFDLLQAVREHGSISHAAQALGLSYRHVWGTLKEWEATLGEALIEWVRGKPARLSPFAERLLWAERRARTRVQPHIEALRADLGRMLSDARDPGQQLLSVCASHDLALPLLQQQAGPLQGLNLDLRFAGSLDSLRALSAGHSSVAGFHVPQLQGAAPLFARAMKPLLKPGVHKLIGCWRRQQGLMMRRETSAAVHGLEDLLQRPLRFVNRQVGSGTRLLMDHLLHEAGLDAARIDGFSSHVELSHVAVAASVASGLADVGPGIEAAAVEFGLHFVPLIEEDYFLACRKSSLAGEPLQRLCALLASPEWRRELMLLPGYAPMPEAGRVLRMTEALPWWHYRRGKRPAAAAPPVRGVPQGGPASVPAGVPANAPAAGTR